MTNISRVLIASMIIFAGFGCASVSSQKDDLTAQQLVLIRCESNSSELARVPSSENTHSVSSMGCTETVVDVEHADCAATGKYFFKQVTCQRNVADRMSNGVYGTSACPASYTPYSACK